CGTVLDRDTALLFDSHSRNSRRPGSFENFSAWRPDVILLDIGMPGMDGYEVARRVRQQMASRKVMLIALTGWGQEKDRKLAREAGFDYYLLKPVDLQALQALMAAPQP
ncbi:MAG: response regulator, partial [Pseudomonadota bacterium]|nr:response regulator [Pseudomonadota bacterium]